MLAPETTGVCRLPPIAAEKARLICQRESCAGLFTTESAGESEALRGVAWRGLAHRAARPAGFAADLGASFKNPNANKPTLHAILAVRGSGADEICSEGAVDKAANAPLCRGGSCSYSASSAVHIALMKTGARIVAKRFVDGAEALCFSGSRRRHLR